MNRSGSRSKTDITDDKVDNRKGSRAVHNDDDNVLQSYDRSIEDGKVTGNVNDNNDNDNDRDNDREHVQRVGIDGGDSDVENYDNLHDDEVDDDHLRQEYFSKFQTIFRVHGGAIMKIKTGQLV